jgi:hypothetical protein
MKLKRLLLGGGFGIVFIWIAACLVNTFHFHRVKWSWANSHDFLYSGVILVLVGATLHLLSRLLPFHFGA